MRLCKLFFCGSEKDEKKRNPAALKITNDIIAAYKPESVEEMQETVKDVFGPLLEAILNGEMENYLGYGNNSKSKKSTENFHLHKTVDTTKSTSFKF